MDAVFFWRQFHVQCSFQKSNILTRLLWNRWTEMLERGAMLLYLPFDLFYVLSCLVSSRESHMSERLLYLTYLGPG
jgi:hypothetical protein